MSATRSVGIVRLSIAQLRYNRGLTVLAIIGVALAVLCAVLFMSLGASIIVEGEAEIERVGGDLWVTTGPTRFAPTAIGHVDQPIPNAHELSAELHGRDDVQAARAFAFQSVYIGDTTGEYETMTAAGITGDGRIFRPVSGETFSGGDSHYAGGSYDGPMSYEVIVDERAAAYLDVEVGETLHIGGTLVAADEHEFTVVGISNEIGNLVGTPTVVLHLAELQRISGSTGTDPASAIIIATEEDEPQVVRDRLEADHPDLTVRTNREQLEMVLGRQSLILASASVFLVVGVIGGAMLVLNIFGLVVSNQRREFAALIAMGVPVRRLITITCAQGLIVGLIAGGIGLALAGPAIFLLNHVIARVVGFEEVIEMYPSIWLLCAGLAVVVAICGAGLASLWTIRDTLGGAA